MKPYHKAACLSCFENAKDMHWAGDCQEYTRQIAFTKRVRRLLSNETPWHERPVPQVSYEAPHYSLPAVMPEVKAFRVALKALGDWQRDVMGAPKVGTCAECLYEQVTVDDARKEAGETSHGYQSPWLDIPGRLAKIAHTCGKVVVVPKPKRRTQPLGSS